MLAGSRYNSFTPHTGLPTLTLALLYLAPRRQFLARGLKKGYTGYCAAQRIHERIRRRRAESPRLWSANAVPAPSCCLVIGGSFDAFDLVRSR